MFDDELAPDVLATIGPRVHRLRVAKGLTQQQLAGREFTRAYVSAVEVGTRRASPRAARHFADRLGMSVEDLCFGYDAGGHAQVTRDLAGARRLLSEGRSAEAESIWQRIADDAAGRADTATQAKALCGLGRIARHRGKPQQALGRYAEALELLAGASARQRLDATLGLMGALFATGDIARALRLAEDELRQPDGATGADVTVRFALSAATVLPLIERGDLAGASAAADTALELASAVDDNEVLAQGYYHIIRLLTARHRYDEAPALLNRAIVLFEHLGLPTEAATCRFAGGYLYARQGDLVRAEAELRAAAEILRRTGAVHRLLNVVAELADVVRRTGDLDQAGALVAEARRLAADAHQYPEQSAELDRIAAMVAADRGEHEAAWRLFGTAIDGYRAIGAVSELAATARVYGDLLAAAGRNEDALAIYRIGLLAVEDRP